MALLSRNQTKTSRSVQAHRQPMLQMALFSFVAATVGTVVGFVAAIAVALPIVHQDLAAQTNLLGTRLASSVTSAAPASSCAQPSSGGVVLGAAVLGGGSGGGMPSSPHGEKGGGTFIKKLVGGQLAITNAAIRDTGPDSENKIVTTNTAITHVENTNNISISNTTDQDASSGSAKVDGNTTGGDALSGASANRNNTGFDLKISN